MTIEQKINNLLSKTFNVPIERLGFMNIINRGWTLNPMSVDLPKDRIACEIDEMIKQTDNVICLTSKALYIRKCKKWFMENK